jgi:2-methylcitrate dehydratase PrpD
MGEVAVKKEQALAKFVYETKFQDLTKETVETVKRQLIALYAATIAGNDSEGCGTVADLARALGGKEEATILIHGGKVPAHEAAFVNAVMGRAWDICDHIAPGVHIGSAVIPAALAAAELAGGCTGEELITAVAVGTELSLRLNLEEEDYAGFDPTGVCAVYAAAAASAKLLGLDEAQILNALGLVFNKCGASFQSNIDGTLAVRIIEGWVAEAGLKCARLAKLGISGPVNFLDGVYGYYHLFGRDKKETDSAVEGLGTVWHLTDLNFKKYPSCGQTQGSTCLILEMMEKHGFSGDDVERVEVLVPPFTYKLVGHFQLGGNPKVNAQFSVGYCVANALVRPPVKLSHFEPEEIKQPLVLDFLEKKVKVISEPAIEARPRHHYSSDIHVWTKDGRKLAGQIEVPPGTPGNPMTDAEHRQRFYDCVAFAGIDWLTKRSDAMLEYLEHMERKKNIEEFISLFLYE